MHIDTHGHAYICVCMCCLLSFLSAKLHFMTEFTSLFPFYARCSTQLALCCCYCVFFFFVQLLLLFINYIFYTYICMCSFIYTFVRYSFYTHTYTITYKRIPVTSSLRQCSLLFSTSHTSSFLLLAVYLVFFLPTLLLYTHHFYLFVFYFCYFNP